MTFKELRYGDVFTFQGRKKKYIFTGYESVNMTYTYVAKKKWDQDLTWSSRFYLTYKKSLGVEITKVGKFSYK